MWLQIPQALTGWKLTDVIAPKVTICLVQALGVLVFPASTLPLLNPDCFLSSNLFPNAPVGKVH